VDSKALERELREKHLVHVKYRRVEHVEGLRVSPHIYMLKTDLDTFAAALRDVIEHAGH
jgi:selenocysteine lyase/cysteine desulfurase